MASTNKTPNIGLNSWVGTDLIKREDFNADNIIIDTKIKESVDKIAILNGSGDTKEKANLDYVNTQLVDYTKITPYAGTTTGVANSYVISTPVITELVVGMSICVKIHTSSTGSCTLNWCGKGGYYILTPWGSVPNLKTNAIYTLRYNGAAFIIQGADEYATETTTGIVELATTAEVTAGLDTTRVVTPKTLKDQGYFNQSNYGNISTIGSTTTLALAHANTVLQVAGATTILTIPTNSAIPFPIGTQITITLYTGTCTLAPSAGTILLSKDNKRTIDGLYASATLIKASSDIWYLIGALK